MLSMRDINEYVQEEYFLSPNRLSEEELGRGLQLLFVKRDRVRVDRRYLPNTRNRKLRLIENMMRRFVDDLVRKQCRPKHPFKFKPKEPI